MGRKESEKVLKRIKIYRRYKDYYTLNSLEVRASLLFTVIFCFVLLNIFQIYEKFFLYIDSIKDIVLGIIAGNFGLLGMSLAGMAIITSLFTPDILRVINKVDKNDTVNRVLSSFEFSALNIIFQIIYLILIFLALTSDKKIIDKIIFQIIFFLVIYHLFFNLFYILALIGSCIKLNSLKTSCEAVKKVEKSLPDIANEIRIDYLLATILKNSRMNRKEFLNILDDMIDSSNINEKEALREYLYTYYHDKKINRD